MISLTTPISEPAVRALKLGDEVLINGTLFTGRDAVHKYLHDGGQLPAGVNLQGGVLYHCAVGQPGIIYDLPFKFNSVNAAFHLIDIFKHIFKFIQLAGYGSRSRARKPSHNSDSKRP